MKKRQIVHYVICVNNRGYRASLERGKVYRVREVVNWGGNRLVRLQDELDDVALYPVRYFMPIVLERPVRQALALAS